MTRAIVGLLENGLGSLLICTILYIAVAAVLTGLVPYPKLNVPDPMAVGIDVIGVPWLAILVKFGALTGLTSVVLVFLYGQSRIFLTMAKDGLLPPVFHTLLNIVWPENPTFMSRVISGTESS